MPWIGEPEASVSRKLLPPCAFSPASLANKYRCSCPTVGLFAVSVREITWPCWLIVTLTDVGGTVIEGSTT